MFSPRQRCSGISTRPSGKRRRVRRVSANGYFVAGLAAKNKLMVSHRRVPLSVINASSEATRLLSMQPTILPSTLTPVSDEYIREKLSLFQDSFLTGLRNVRLSTPPQRSGFLPKELQIITNDCLNALPPTHILAVYASKSGPSTSSASRTKVTLFPAHEIVLSAHCANLPKLPGRTSPNTVPVIPLALPSPIMYPYLLNYLYTKNLAALEHFLLPPPLPQQMQAANLMKHLLATHGLWGNACALGVIDKPLYAMVERAWGSLHQCLRAVHLPTSLSNS